MRCHYCENEIRDDAQFCTYCGRSVYHEPQMAYSGDQNVADQNMKNGQKNLKVIIPVVIGVVIGIALAVYLICFRNMNIAVAKPVYSVPGGTFEKAQSVEILSEDKKLTIYYTTDGSVPTTSSTKYAYGDVISVKKSMIIKSIAADNFGNVSDVSVAEYTINTAKKVKDQPQPQVIVVEKPTTRYSNYVLPDSNSRYYSSSELYAYSSQMLCYARNEIYARHGYIFKSKELQNYFGGQGWYHGTNTVETFDTSVFNDYENQNIKTIKSVEESKGMYSLD